MRHQGGQQITRVHGEYFAWLQGRGIGRTLVAIEGANFAGDVTDAKDQPFQAATSVLVPNSRNRTDLYKSATSDQNGKFNLTNVAPGDYKLFVWEAIPAGAYFDSTYLKAFEDKGKPITIGKAAAARAQMYVIPASPQ